MMKTAREKPGTALLVRPRTLTLAELTATLLELPVHPRIENGHLIVEKSMRGWPFKQPVRVPLDRVLAVRERGLVAYIIKAFASERPRLIQFVFENESLVRMSRHFLRNRSGSLSSLYAYVDDVSRYSRYLDGLSPDMIIKDVKSGGNIPDAVKVENHAGLIDGYLAELQDQGLSPGRVKGVEKHLKTFYRTNGIKIELQETRSRKVVYKDRAPTAEELQKLLDIADLREKVIVSMMALSAVRESTLARLQYRHVREDIEANRTPIHIHVAADETKAHSAEAADYDTFLRAEAAEFLRLYLDQRRKGSPEGGIAPEDLVDTSPLIRDKRSPSPRPIGPKAIRRVVCNLYRSAGMVKKSGGRMFEVRVHSLRKFFKTRMEEAGVNTDYIEYMMGHVVNTYHDVQNLPIEKLRNAYAASDLSIRPKTKAGKSELVKLLKEVIRAHGRNPEEILGREAMMEGATTHIGNDHVDHSLQVLAKTLGNLLRDDVLQQPLQQGSDR